ncbi:MAG: LLM class flavin-dependent oxidoreductase [Proteobacteria bacterium]|nr:LLM class flavin-dependent oxidoreductase [Pseudomonadota bacterium]
MSEAKLKFGLWYSLRNPRQWHRPDTEIYTETLDQIAWAETIGYDDVWLTEHHFCDDAHAPSILTLAAAVAVRTKKIRIGTAVLLLPLHDAVRVAEDCATIDILSNGRFELGVGIGYRPQEFDGLGFKRSDRAGRTNEGLEIIRRLWEGETVDYDGEHYQIKGAKLAPLPVQKPRPPLWVGGFAPASVKRAARLADGFIGTGDISSFVPIYKEERAKLGKSGPGRLAGGHFWLIVSNDPKKTFSQVAPYIIYQLQMYNVWLQEAGQTPFPEANNEQQLRESGMLQVLTPSEAVDAIGTYVEQTGIERYYTWTVPPGMPAAQMNEYLELFASEVMPKFR